MKDIYWKIEQVLSNLRQVPENFRESTEMLKKWLLMKDSNGLRPEIFVTISNRTGGKTYFLTYLLLKLYKDYGVKFGLYTRFGTDLGNVAVEMFNAVLKQEDEFEGWEMSETVALKNVYSTVDIIHDEKWGDEIERVHDTCGYVLATNSSDKIKKISSLFVDVEIMFADEFQAEMYAPKETDKFVNIHFSVARGDEEGVRVVPVLMASNSLSIQNPYFEMWGLTTKIQSNTKYFHGDGLVLLRFVNEKVAAAQMQSAFNRACKNSNIIKSNIGNEWLNDNWACIGKPAGRGQYICTLTVGKHMFGLRMHADGIYSVNRSVDNTAPRTFNLTSDPKEDVTSFRDKLPFQVLRKAWFNGKVLFSDISVKSLVSPWL